MNVLSRVQTPINPISYSQSIRDCLCARCMEVCVPLGICQACWLVGALTEIAMDYDTSDTHITLLFQRAFTCTHGRASLRMLNSASRFHVTVGSPRTIGRTYVIRADGKWKDGQSSGHKLDCPTSCRPRDAVLPLSTTTTLTFYHFLLSSIVCLFSPLYVAV
jgi:hypothetical protein